MNKIVKIQNPTAGQGIVRLQPGQILELTVTDQQVTLGGEFVLIERTETLSNRRIYWISHCCPEDTNSTVYLGDVSLRGSNAARLMVYLEPKDPEHRQVMTIVRPTFCESLRVKPHQLLEVVCFQTTFRPGVTHWSWSWKPSAEFAALKIEELDYRVIGGTTPPSCAFPFSPVRWAANRQVLQYHLWFRFGAEILQLFEMAARSKYVGVVHLQGYDNWQNYNLYPPLPPPGKTTDECSIELYVDLEKKHQKATEKTLSINAVDCHKSVPPQPRFREIELSLIDGELDTGCRLSSTEVDSQPPNVLK